MTQGNSNVNPKQSAEDDAYEKAITAYQFHVERYNTWMNYYSIFVGALFLAYYSIKPDSNSEFILSVITIVGLISSACWLASFKGYYSWLLSWTQVIQFHEKRIIDNDDKLRVYTLISKNILEQNGFSTQKITRAFINVIILAWLVLIGFELYKINNNQCVSIFVPIVIALILICLFNIPAWKKCLFSNIDSKFVDIKDLEAH